jgi:hypothetical protein
MIDAARLPEPLPYYRRLVDHCAEWGFNAILFRLADDQGSALRFAGHPELVTHVHAYSPEELVGLVEYAAARGIDLIPEIESFGHTGYITRVPAYAHLLDADPAGNAHFTGIMPLHPEMLSLLGDLYREVAAVFPSRYLHAGCDEVNWGGSDYSRALIDQRGRSAVWAAHLNELNRLARSLDKELIVWGDHVLGGGPVADPADLEALDRDIILHDWNYWDNDPSRSAGWGPRPGPVESAARLALERGFRVVGGPAWGWCRWGVRPGESQLRNIDAFADVYRAAGDPRCLGVLVTNWVPGRFILGSAWDGPAYAGTALEQGAESARREAFPRFVRRFYGAEWNAVWADLFRGLAAFTPPRRGCAPGWLAPFQPLLWSSDETLRAAIHDTRFDAHLPFARLRRQAAECTVTIQRNEAEFAAFELMLEYLEHLHWRAALTAGAGRDPGLDLGQTARLLRTIAGRDARLVEAVYREWDRARFSDCPSRAGLFAGLSLEDQLLYNLAQAAAFSAALVEDPARFLAAASLGA